MAKFADHMEKIESGVVEGYKKIEDGVVTGYKKVEDAFVNAFLAKEGETAEEAKARITAGKKDSYFSNILKNAETGALYNAPVKIKKEVMNMHSNDQEFLVQKIRTQYTEKQHTELDALKELDAKVKRPANVFAYTYGSIGAVIMGAGMSLVMTEIGGIIGLASAMVPGIVIGVVGMGMALSTYPIYKKLLSARKKKYAPEILKLSEKIMNG